MKTFDELLHEAEAYLERNSLVEGPEPLNEFCDGILRQMALQGAEEVHLDPGNESGKLTFWKNGQQRIVYRISISLHNLTIKCIKILASLNICEKVKPQQRDFRWEKWEFTASTMGVDHGEQIVVRLMRTVHGAS